MSLQLEASFGENISMEKCSPDDYITAISIGQEKTMIVTGDGSGKLFFYRSKVTGTTKKRTQYVLASKTRAYTQGYDTSHFEPVDFSIISLDFQPKNSYSPLILVSNRQFPRLYRIQHSVINNWPKTDLSSQFSSLNNIDQFILPTPERSNDNFSFQLVESYFDPLVQEIVNIHCLPDQESFLQVDIFSVKERSFESYDSAFNLFEQNTSQPIISSSTINPFYSYLFALGFENENNYIFDIRSHSITNKIYSKYFPTCSLSFDITGNFIAIRSPIAAEIWDIRNSSKPLNSQIIFPKEDESFREYFPISFTKHDQVLSGQYGSQFIRWNWKQSIVYNEKAGRRQFDQKYEIQKRISNICTDLQTGLIAMSAASTLFIYQE